MCICGPGRVQDGDSCALLDAGADNSHPDAAVPPSDGSALDAADALPSPASDASAEAATSDASDAAADATSELSTPDAGGSDAGRADAGLRCVPMGVYMSARTKLHGDCNTGLSQFETQFNGKLSDPYLADPSCPNFDGGISEDGCTLTYVQHCDSSATAYELETGTLTMNPQDGTITGMATVSDHQVVNGVDQTLCTSDYLFSAGKE